jgi:drug/metabolite transporter (DMT)-like permease
MSLLSRLPLGRLAPPVFVVLWATGFIGARAGMPHAEPGTFLFLRFSLAFILLSGLVVIARAPWPKGRKAFQALAVGALLHGVYLGGVFWAVREGMPAGVVAVVVGLQPILTAILAGWLLGETITMRHRIGLLLGVLGVVLVLYPKLSFSGDGITPATIGASFLACLGVTLGTILQKATGGTGHIRSGAALQYLGALAPVGLLSLFETRQITWNGELVFALAWLTLVLSVGAVFLLLWLIREGSVASVSTLFFLTPAVAALLAWALFGETLGPVQLIGMALSAGAVRLASAKRTGPA